VHVDLFSLARKALCLFKDKLCSYFTTSYIYKSQYTFVCFHLTPSRKKFVAKSIRIFSVCAAFNPIRVFSLRMIEAEIATSINVG